MRLQRGEVTCPTAHSGVTGRGRLEPGSLLIPSVGHFHRSGGEMTSEGLGLGSQSESGRKELEDLGAVSRTLTWGDEQSHLTFSASTTGSLIISS